MKLYAVVDKELFTWRLFLNKDNACEYAGIHGYLVEELHAYDPATQIVVPVEVYDDICLILKYRPPAKSVFEKSIFDSVSKFLAAKEAK